MNIFEEVNKKLSAFVEEEDYMKSQHDKDLTMDIEDLGYVDTDAGKTYLLDNAFEFILMDDLKLDEERIQGWLKMQFAEELEEGAFKDIIVKDLKIKDGKGTFTCIFVDQAEDMDESINEGEVISFADFKKEKEADKAIEGAEEEVIHAKVLGVKTVNYNIDGSQILDSRETYDFKYLQTILHALGQILRMQDSTDAIALSYDLVLNDGKEEQKLKHGGDVILGSDIAKESMLNDLTTYFEGAFDKAVIIDGDLLPSDNEVSKKVLELQKQLRLDKKAGIAKEPAEAKDYSKGETKFGQDVEVGDILYYSYNYGRTQHYFLKVVDKKGASIKLAKLEKITKLNNDDDGEVVPSNVIDHDAELEKRWFRIHKSKADWDNVVCKYNDRNCYYWNGKPKHETYMD